MSIQRKSIIIIFLILLIAAALVWVRSFLFNNLGATIHKKILSMEISGFNVRYDSLSVDWLDNVIEINGLILEKNAYDTTCIYPEFIAVKKVRAEGLRSGPGRADSRWPIATSPSSPARPRGRHSPRG